MSAENEILKKYYKEEHQWEFKDKYYRTCKNCSASVLSNSSEPCINWNEYLKELKENAPDYLKKDKKNDK